MSRRIAYAALLVPLTLILSLGGCPPAGNTGTDPNTTGGTTADLTPGVLQLKAFTDSLGAPARVLPNAQTAPDDVDVNLSPTEYSIAFKRIVLKEVDEATDTTLNEVELFSVDDIDDALLVDLLNDSAADLLDVSTLPAGTYNKMDIEVFYLDVTVPTIYPADVSHDIPYRMVFEEMGKLEPRDFLLNLDPNWMDPNSILATEVTIVDWYWMQREDPDIVHAVSLAPAHPDFAVLDLFANDEFWGSEHKVLEGGYISPPLTYDPNAGGVLTIQFDVAGTFNFKDYHDDTEDADGLWEIRKDAGIHPFPPDFVCSPTAPAAAATKE